MKRSLYLSLCFLFCTTAFSQKVIPEFGQIEVSDLRLAACAFEPEATAMKLFDLTESELTYDQYNSTLKTEKRVRIKIFTEAGYGYATVKITYPRKSSTYKIENLKAVVYNLDEAGKVISRRLERKDFFKNKSDDYTGVINFTFPQLKPGSVVEYSYTRTEYDVLRFDTWSAQDLIPALYAANAIIVPTESRLIEKYFGIDTVQQRLQMMSGNRDRYTYYKENVASFRREPYMTSVRDNLLRVAYFFIPRKNTFVDFFSAPDQVWNIVGHQILNSRFLIGQIATDIPGTDSLWQNAKKMASVPDRIRYLFAAVKAHAPADAEQTFLPVNILEAWKNRSGSTAELNLILINLLRRAGVPCFPLLVSTRVHGNIRTDFPNISQFNGLDVVAMDSAKAYVLDASVKNESYAVPPANVINRLGLLLNEQRIHWMQVTEAKPLMNQTINIQARLHEDGKLAGYMTAVSYDYAKMALLDSSDRDPDTERTGKPDGLKIVSYKIGPSGSDEEPVKEETEFEWQTQKAEGFYFVKPRVFAPLAKNPFVNDTRATDIDFGCNQEVKLALTVAIPPTSVVEFLPKDVVLISPDSSFSYKRSCTQTASEVSFSQTFQIRRNQFYKEDYPAIRDFFKKFYALTDEEIIFKKKN